MEKLKIQVLLLLVLSGIRGFSQAPQSQHATFSPTKFISGSDVFGCRVFIENRGQYQPVKGQKVLYVLDNGQEKIYFTLSGLIYELRKFEPLSKEEFEEIEHGKPSPFEKAYFVHMNWQGANDIVSLDAAAEQSYYMTYGSSDYNSKTYKKITYRNVYNNIDIEYQIPTDKATGIKYSLILKPGARADDIRIVYSGDVSKIRMNSNQEIEIRTPVDDLIEHKPSSFYAEGTNIPSRFILKNGIIGYSLDVHSPVEKDIIIDPWVSSTNPVTTNAMAFDVDYDYFGRTFVYGGLNPYKVACYGISGALNWVFMGTVVSHSWTSSPLPVNASNIGVAKQTGKTYVGQGFILSGTRVIRLNSSGNFDNFITTADPLFQEVWDIGFHCTSNYLFAFGGSTSAHLSSATIDTSWASVIHSSFSGSTVTPPPNGTVVISNPDIVSHAIDNQGNIFAIYASFNANNPIVRVAPSFTTNTWMASSHFSVFTEAGNKAYYQAGLTNSNGFNCLAANNNYLFYYNGLNVAAFDKQSGAILGSTFIGGHTALAQGGIAVDDCNNLYLGGKGQVLCFNFDGASFSTLSPLSLSGQGGNMYIYDLRLDKNTSNLYACGSGFVGVLAPIHTTACATASSICSSFQTSITVQSDNVSCASLGSATCTAIGGTGPFSYTWIPSGQTGSVASNLAPGAYKIIVHDLGASHTYTALSYISPVVPLSGSIPNPLKMNCGGATIDTVSINNLSGGTGHFSYLWTNGVTTQTTAAAFNLGSGNHTVTVTDSVSNCIWLQTFSIVAPPTLSLMLAPDATIACAHTSISIIGLVTGGSPNYSFSWVNGPQASNRSVTEAVGGTYVYTLNAFDSKNCKVTNTISLHFIPAPTITINSPSICPGESATLIASGALTYTWNNGSFSHSIVEIPASSTVYSISGTGSLCSGSATTQITVLSLPSPTLSSNSPVCGNNALILSAAGGSLYSWSGPGGFSSSASNPFFAAAVPSLSGVYTATVTSANSCTASASIQVTVHPAPDLIATGSSVCITDSIRLTSLSTAPGRSYLWSGPLNFTSSLQNPSILNPNVLLSGNYTVTVRDTNACKTSAVVQVTVFTLPSASVTAISPLCENSLMSLDGSVSTDALTYLWSGPNNYQSSQPIATLANVSLQHAGIYTFVVMRGACVDSTTFHLSILPAPQGTIHLLPLKVCETKSFSLQLTTSSGVNSYSWNGPGNFSSLTKDVFRDSSDATYTGLYTATISDTNSCKSTKMKLVPIYKNPLLTAADLTVCLHSKATLYASGANYYTWKGPLFSGQGASAVIHDASNVHPETYTVIASDTNQCTSEKTILLSTYPLPKPALKIVPGPVLCINDQVSFMGEGGIRYEWRGPQNLYFETKAVSFICLNQVYSGSHTLTVEDANGCRASKDTSIFIHNLPVGSLSGEFDGCVPLCAPYHFTPSKQTVSSTWKTNNFIQGGPSFTLCFQQPGRHEILGHLTDTATGCENEIKYSVNAREKPEAAFDFEPIRPVEYDKVQFINTTPENQTTVFEWFFHVPGGHFTNVKNPEYMFTTEGKYPVALVAINSMGCADTVVRTVVVEADFQIYVPNAFTPNGDDRNDVFMPVVHAPRKYHLMVFDRWGEFIFESTDPAAGWDGTYKGQACKDDSYTWKISLVGRNGEIRNLSGHVTLFR